MAPFLKPTPKRVGNADFLADDQHCTHGSHARSPIVLTKFATCLPSCFTCAKFPILFVYGNNTKKRWPKISSELFADAQTTTRYRTLTQFSTELYFASRTSSFRFLEENLLAIIICPVLIALLNKTTAFLEKLLLNTPITTLKCRNDSQETNSHSPKSKDTFTKNYFRSRSRRFYHFPRCARRNRKNLFAQSFPR